MKSEWWDEIFDYSYERFTVAYTAIACLLLTIRILISIALSIDLVFTTPYIQMTLILFGLCGTMYAFKKKSRNMKKVILYIIVELFNILLKVLSYNFFQKDSTILCLTSTLVTLFFQSNIFESTWPHIFIAIKHITIWYLMDAKLFISKNFTSPLGFQIFVVVLWVTFESQKRTWLIKLFSSRQNEKEALHQFSEILRVFPDGLMIINQSFDIKFINETASRVLGDNKESLNKALGEAKLVDCDTSILELVKTNGFLSNAVIKSLGITNVGTLLYEWTITQVKWEDEDSCMIIIKDVTKMLILERSAAENKTKASIIRSVSHELRTPVNAIILMLEKLLKKSSPKLTKKLSCIKVCAHLLKFQINDILDYTKLISNHFILNNIKCDIKSSLKECVEFIKVQAKYKGIQIISKIDHLIPDNCFLDIYRIQKVVMNLLSNAIKYTNKGTIELIAIHTGSGVNIKVKDTGIGIPKIRLEQIMEMLNDDLQSCLSGLGLYISKTILKKMNSQIKVVSSQGKGSEFSFTLEIFEPFSSELTENDIPDENKICVDIPFLSYRILDRNPAQILIVDDNDFNRMCLASILKSKGIMFLEAVNGEEAIKIVMDCDKRGHELKCVIMDCNMPIIDGWEASKKIRSKLTQGIIKNSPAIIGYTAYSSSEDIQRCYDSGMVSYLTKPTAQDDLISLISKYIN
ncbi:hypothetical protein SteCoe_15183 [Stentor coeruleus]|uniref:Histidine kinase n=1 Tax=Stentor coeruleus TaxID=5963 RepID=A0A1R2C468_9CILI|nr:hypothetical protein SteCoe_15183 [Stentor coeruleus]